MNTTHFFLGANSAEGFYGLYEQLLDAKLYDLLILKGGPGCGKSTFMHRAAAALEARGAQSVYIHCSGDPNSLDAVFFPAIRTAIVDGTAPHGMAPLGHSAKKVRFCKALRGRLLDGTSTWHGYLGHFYGTSYLIRGVTAQKKTLAAKGRGNRKGNRKNRCLRIVGTWHGQGG